MWARVLRDRRRRRSAGTSVIRPAIRRRARSRPAWACSAHRWGGGGRGSRAHCDITSDGSVVDASAARRTSAPARARSSRWSRPRRSACRSARCKPEIGDTNYPFSGGIGRQHDGGVASCPAIRIAAVKALDALVREGRADARRRRRRRSSPKAAASTSRATPSKGMSWKDACKLIGTEPISVDGEWEARPVVDGTSGVQFAEVDVDIETGIVKVKRILAMQDCGLDRRQADRREPGLRRHHRVAQLRAVRGSHPRPQHRPDGQPEHGVVPAGRHVRHPEDRHHR